jgi:hypothetical protein
MNERGARGDEPVDRLDGLAQPVDSGGNRGDRDIRARGSQTPEGMLPASPKKERSQ